MTDNNRRQAMVPRGASIVDNPNGTAPGLWMERDGTSILLLPGPRDGARRVRRHDEGGGGAGVDPGRATTMPPCSDPVPVPERSARPS